jgi:molybdenum cofactor synthesis domain-containing protein
MRLSLGILTISDRAAAGEMEDAGGPAVAEALRHGDWQVTQRAVVPDDGERISSVLQTWCDELHLDVIFTTGGTGLGPRDVTPEATLSVANRPVPGIAETIRAASLRQTPHAMLSRGVAAVRGTTLLINLPGSPRGAAEGVEVVRPILEHAVATLHGGRH